MDALVKLIAAAFRSLVPSLDADPVQQYRWRLAVFLWGTASWVFLVAFATLATGAVPGIFPGFARSDTVKALVDRSNFKDQGDLRRAILVDQEKFCNAASTGPSGKPKNRSAAEIWLKLRQDDLALYDAASQHAYQLPPCVEVLVGGFSDGDGGD